MSDVQRYWVEELQQLSALVPKFYSPDELQPNVTEVVEAAAYDALLAERDRLRHGLEEQRRQMEYRGAEVFALTMKRMIDEALTA